MLRFEFKVTGKENELILEKLLKNKYNISYSNTIIKKIVGIFYQDCA